MATDEGSAQRVARDAQGADCRRLDGSDGRYRSRKLKLTITERVSGTRHCIAKVFACPFVVSSSVAMPPFHWPSDPTSAVIAFEQRHTNPEAGALLLWAASSVEALYYLDDVDSVYDSTRTVHGAHRPDVVDVAHARWATGTCITALDLGAAALGRALGGHIGDKELNLGSFSSTRRSKALCLVLSSMPPLAMHWIQAVTRDPAFTEMKTARDALTHRRLPRHLYASVGSAGPDRRLDLQIDSNRVPVRKLVEDARDLATVQISRLLGLLPQL